MVLDVTDSAVLPESSLLTIKETCKILNCHPNSLRKWDKDGLLKAVRIGKRGDRRFQKSDIIRFLKMNRIDDSYDYKNDADPTANGSLNRTAQNQIHAKDALISINLDGKVTYWSGSAQEIYGYSASEMLHNSIKNLINPDLQYELPDLLSVIKNGNTVDNYETVRRHKNGESIRVLLHLRPIRNAKGKVTGATSISKDITKQRKNEELEKRLEQQAIISELGLKALTGMDIKKFMQEVTDLLVKMLDVEYAKVLELVPNKKHVILRAGTGWNKNVIVDKSIVGIGKNSQAGYTLLSKHPVIVKDLRTETRFNGPKLLRDHNVISGMSVVIHQKLRPFGVLGVHSRRYMRFTKDDVNFLQSVANLLSLVMTRRNAEEKIREREEQFHLWMQNLGDIITVISDDCRILYHSPSIYRILGYRPQERIGKSFYEMPFTHPDDIQNKRTFIDELKKNPNTNVTATFRLQHKNGGWRFIETTGRNLLKNPYVKAIVATHRDITERRMLEKQKDDFLAVASHELKTPVTSIKAYNQILQQLFDKETRAEKEKELLIKMDSQINKLTTLINDLLDVTKIESGQLKFNMEIFCLNDLVKEVVNDMQHTTEKHTLSINLDESCNIYGDRDRIGQVITNFLTNAIKYSPHSEKIKIKSQLNNGQVLLSVQDFGIGIDAKIKDKVFDRFYRIGGKELDTIPGMGLGLYISSEIIRRLGGNIGVNSEPKKGSTFYFSLPLSDGRKPVNLQPNN